MLTAALFAVVAASITGAVILVHGLMTAPEGCETENGFEMVWCNNRPDLKDVVCIWAQPTM